MDDASDAFWTQDRRDGLSAALAAWIARRRVKKAVLARETGVARGTLDQILKGKTNPRLETLARAAEYLGTSAGALVDGELPPPAPPQDPDVIVLDPGFAERRRTRVKVGDQPGSITLVVPEKLPPLLRQAVRWFPMRDEFDALREEIAALRRDRQVLADALLQAVEASPVDSTQRHLPPATVEVLRLLAQSDSDEATSQP